jgi:predicted Fe-Mo cluster-binding NifX family protein
MIVCVPVTEDGSVDPRWGRAHRVAVATLTDDGLEDWQEIDVGWDELHDSASEGSHHARIARFLRERQVDTVVARHMGAAMAHMLEKMALTVQLGATGDARAAASEARAARRPSS